MLLGDLAGQAVQAGGPGLSWAAFISGALRELRQRATLTLPFAGAPRPCAGQARTS
jgi:hypothetical protein